MSFDAKWSVQAMNIVVAIRLVPDISGDVELTPDEKDIDREWIDMRLNELDEHALEEAIVLKERFGAKVTAVAIDTEGADRLLRGALARGADDAVKISCDGNGPPSSRAAARMFSSAARSLAADLFLTGVQTPEDTYGQLAPFVGAILDWPCVSAVSAVQLGEGAVTVTQELSGGGTATLRLRTPAVVGVQAASQPVRYIAGSKLREAAGRKIPILQAAREESPEVSELLRISLPDRAGGAVMLDGDAQTIAGLLQRLFVERGLLKG
jgi:electron transfer flavoprotein beta subunit